MQLRIIHSYLLHPAKGAPEQPTIRGTSIGLSGLLHKMLSSVFDRAPVECGIEILFRPHDDGTRQNACRDLVLAYVANAELDVGRAIAARLQAVTTRRSGLGLLFLMLGVDDDSRRIVMSRFAADQGVVAHEGSRALSVEFIERVFLKDALRYKSAMYESDSLRRGFWDGAAIDRQIRSRKELSDYWIREFLDSQLMTTGPAGTKRLAVALRDAARTARDVGVRQELVAAASLMRGLDRQMISASEVAQRFGLSATAAGALVRNFPGMASIDDVFQFDSEEFDRHVRFRSVELDNGGHLTADVARFDRVFQESLVDPSSRRYRFSTEGTIVNDTLRNAR